MDIRKPKAIGNGSPLVGKPNTTLYEKAIDEKQRHVAPVIVGAQSDIHAKGWSKFPQINTTSLNISSPAPQFSEELDFDALESMASQFESNSKSISIATPIKKAHSNSDFENQLKKSLSELEAMKKKLSDAQTSIDSLTAQNKQLADQNVQNKQEIAGLSRKVDEVNAFSKSKEADSATAMKKLKTQLEERTKLCTGLKSDLTFKEQDRKVLENELTQKIHELEAERKKSLARQATIVVTPPPTRANSDSKKRLRSDSADFELEKEQRAKRVKLNTSDPQYLNVAQYSLTKITYSENFMEIFSMQEGILKAYGDAMPSHLWDDLRKQCLLIAASMKDSTFSMMQLLEKWIQDIVTIVLEKKVEVNAQLSQLLSNLLYLLSVMLVALPETIDILFNAFIDEDAKYLSSRPNSRISSPLLPPQPESTTHNHRFTLLETLIAFLCNHHATSAAPYVSHILVVLCACLPTHFSSKSTLFEPILKSAIMNIFTQNAVVRLQLLTILYGLYRDPYLRTKYHQIGVNYLQTLLGLQYEVGEEYLIAQTRLHVIQLLVYLSQTTDPNDGLSYLIKAMMTDKELDSEKAARCMIALILFIDHELDRLEQMEARADPGIQLDSTKPILYQSIHKTASLPQGCIGLPVSAYKLIKDALSLFILLEQYLPTKITRHALRSVSTQCFFIFAKLQQVDDLPALRRLNTFFLSDSAE